MSAVKENNPLDDFTEKFLQAAASGNVDTVQSFIKGTFDVNSTNAKGWTALMFSARNGHPDVAKLLLEKECDVTQVNSLGQTALDIAKFWSHQSIIDLLEPQTQAVNADQKYAGLPNQGMTNFFSHNPLDRTHYRRNDEQWLKTKMKALTTRWVLFNKLSPYVYQLSNSSAMHNQRESYKLVTLQYDDISEYLLSQEEKGSPALVIFLGLDRSDPSTQSSVEEDRTSKDNKATAWFAVDATDLAEEVVKKVNPSAEVTSLYPTGIYLDKKHAGILAQARSILAWHDRYSFCATCGSKTKMADAGYKRVCLNEKCRSNQGVHNTCYPRTDPTVIMAVISPDKKNILFGQTKRARKNFWSCLAGFMEPGESIEDAVRRETYEEAGVVVGRVEYHSCQPWPMPSTLMIGCLAYAESSQIQVDKDELHDARWFSRKEAVQLLTQQHPDNIMVPPSHAIAHQLIKAWVHMTSNL